MNETTITPNYVGGVHNYRFDISVLRIICTIAIICLHMCAILVEHTDIFIMSATQETVLTTVRNFLKGFLPVFYMITGALLLNNNKKITIKQCICKYLIRVLIALWLFGIFYAIIIEVAETKTISISLFPKAVIAVIEGESSAHLWYLYSLIGVYLLLPLFKLYCERASQQTQEFTLTVIFGFVFILPYIERLTGIKVYFSIPIASFPVFYVLLGHYLDTVVVGINRKLLVACLTIEIMISFYLTRYVAPELGNLFSYDSPIVVIIATTLFLSTKGLSIESLPSITADTIWKVDRLCFGTYLVHYLVIEITFRVIRITPLSFGSFWMLACVAFLIIFTFVSFVCTWLMMKIIPLRKYVL